jgi:autotransporter-associated beta strand protein
LVVTANGAMGPATATGIVVNTGGALAFTGGLDYTTVEPITISGSGPAGHGAIENISGTNSFAIPITLSGAATVGAVAGAMTLGGNISTGSNALTVVGAGATMINGNIICQGGSVTLAGTGSIDIAGNINLGPTGNLTDSSSGQDKITGVISGTATSGVLQGLTGTYFNLAASQNLIQPANPSNSAWLGNQTPAVTAQLVGPINFPDIADNGFADSVGNPAYYNVGGGNNNVEARWYGEIMIPGTGTAPVPINFSTTSDDGSMLYIDGNAVVNNNNFQPPTQATDLVNLTPGLHTIDVEYFQGGGGATMDVQWDPTGGSNFVDIPNSAFGGPVDYLIKTGTGTLTLSNTQTYLGSTTVDSGKLVVNGRLLDSDVTVNSGGTLGGDGTVPATTVQKGGVLAPGNSPGTLTAGSLSLAAGSTFHEELGGTTAGTQYDQTIIPAGGSVALGGSTLAISFLPGFLPTIGEQFTIINNRSGSGVIGTFSQGSKYTSAGYTFGINYAGGAGHDVVLTVLAPINPVAGVGVIWGSQTAALQTAGDGIRLLPAGRKTDLPWLSINQLQITLSHAYTLTAADVVVSSAIGVNYGPVTVAGSGTSYKITLAQSINKADRVSITIDIPGTSVFYRRLDVLPGDVNDDGVVNSQDVVVVRNQWLGVNGTKPTIFGDINGDGVVNVSDYNDVRMEIGTALPPVVGAPPALSGDLVVSGGGQAGTPPVVQITTNTTKTSRRPAPHALQPRAEIRLGLRGRGRRLGDGTRAKLVN